MQLLQEQIAKTTPIGAPKAMPKATPKAKPKRVFLNFRAAKERLQNMSNVFRPIPMPAVPEDEEQVIAQEENFLLPLRHPPGLSLPAEDENEGEIDSFSIIAQPSET